MTVTSYKRGHPYYYDGDKTEYYLDNKEPLNVERKCVRCLEMPTKEGHDNCIGELPGVKFACCGHGIEQGYIIFNNGIRIEGYFHVTD